MMNEHDYHDICRLHDMFTFVSNLLALENHRIHNMHLLNCINTLRQTRYFYEVNPQPEE
jgi:hypothetical protein